MAKSRKRRLAGLKAARTRKRRGTSRRRHANPVARVHRRRRRNPGIKTVVRYRNSARRRVGRRRANRNPGALTGTFGNAVEIIAGAVVTRFITGMIPANLSSGIPGYVTTAIVAVLQGKAVGKILKNPRLGSNMTTGGFVYLALKVASDFLPGGLSLNGLGIVGPSSFWTPQVPVNGSMGRFVPPAALTAGMASMQAAPAGMQGIGQRRVGRMR